MPNSSSSYLRALERIKAPILTTLNKIENKIDSNKQIAEKANDIDQKLEQFREQLNKFESGNGQKDSEITLGAKIQKTLKIQEQLVTLCKENDLTIGDMQNIGIVSAHATKLLDSMHTQQNLALAEKNKTLQSKINVMSLFLGITGVSSICLFIFMAAEIANNPARHKELYDNILAPATKAINNCSLGFVSMFKALGSIVSTSIPSIMETNIDFDKYEIPL